MGSYPILCAPDVPCNKGAEPEESISYAGVGIPKLAKSEETEGYETYMEHTLALCNIPEKSTVYDGKVAVAGIILACIPESSHYTGVIPSNNFEVMEEDPYAY